MTLTDIDTENTVTPSADAQLVNMWRSAIMKARLREDEVKRQPDQVALILNFDGAGQPLTVGMCGIPTMPPGAFRIIGCHMNAGIWNPDLLRVSPIPVTASVDIRLTSNGHWAGAGTALYGTTRPTLTAQEEASIDISGWIVELQPGDILPYALATFSGTATVLTLTLLLRRIDLIGIDAPTVVDDSGTTLVDEDGHVVVSH